MVLRRFFNEPSLGELRVVTVFSGATVFFNDPGRGRLWGVPVVKGATAFFQRALSNGAPADSYIKGSYGIERNCRVLRYEGPLRFFLNESS